MSSTFPLAGELKDAADFFERLGRKGRADMCRRAYQCIEEQGRLLAQLSAMNEKLLEELRHCRAAHHEPK